MGKTKAKKPTREQKKFIAGHRLIPDNWLVLSDTDTEMRLVSRGNGRNYRIKKDRLQTV